MAATKALALGLLIPPSTRFPCLRVVKLLPPLNRNGISRPFPGALSDNDNLGPYRAFRSRGQERSV